MPTLPVAFALDILVSILLVAMIVYGVILNRKLTALRSNKAELDVLIHSFNDACSRAEAGVRTLRTATEEAHRLQQYLARGQMLRDDMSFLIERGTGLADRLEGTVRTARSEVQTQTGESPRRGFSRNSANAAPPPPNANGTNLGGLRPPPGAAEMTGVAAMKPASPGPALGQGLGQGRGDFGLAMPNDSAARPIYTASGLSNGGGAMNTNAGEDEQEETEAPAGLPQGLPPRPSSRGGRERANLRSETRGGDVAAPRSRAEKELLDALRAKR
ncbi:MAG: DUF6468 domain-containing protein [Alphaproteobacteria bacterium]|nr:DUF6468 domain-containing protein [Alphaproteobacteria bacterium]